MKEEFQVQYEDIMTQILQCIEWSVGYRPAFKLSYVKTIFVPFFELFEYQEFT